MTTIGYIGRWNNKKKVHSSWIKLEMDKWEEFGYKVESFGWKENDLDINRLRKIDFFICHHADTVKHVYRIGIPYIVIGHAWDIWKDNGAELKVYARNRLCKGIGYISNHHLNKYKKWGLKKDFIDTPVSINLDKFKRTKPLGDKIITGGRITPKKGFEYAIKAVPNIYIYGAMDTEKNYYKYIRNLSSRTTYTGYLKDNELVDLLNGGWLFLFTGIKLRRGDADGIPTTIKEALAMEMQVIASPVHGTVDMKDHIKLIDPKDTKLINKTIKQLPKKRNIKGRKFVEKNYNVNKFIKNVKPIVDRYA